MSKNAVAVKSENQVAVFDDSMFEGMAIGNEEIVAAQYRLPQLKIVEPLSKALIEGEAFYVPGAKVGDIIDTSVGEVIGTEIDFIPVKASTIYKEKNADDMTIAKHEDRAILSKCTWRTEKGKKKGTFLPNGNEIQETIQIFGLNLSSGGDWTVIEFSRGRLAAATTFLQQLNKAKKENGERAPFPYYVWHMEVYSTKSTDGKPFKTWKTSRLQRLLDREDGVFFLEEAKTFFNVLADKRAVVEDTDDDRLVDDDGEAL